MSELSIQEMQAIEIEADKVWSDTLHTFHGDVKEAGRALAVKVLIQERNLAESISSHSCEPDHLQIGM